MSKLKVKETELIDIGKKLGKSQTKDALVKLLLQASTVLAELDQSPPQSTHIAMKGCSEALVSTTLLKHKDKDVGLLVAICISEIMRIVAPDAPYSDSTLKEIFKLIVTNFKGLDDVNSPSFARRVNILETVAKVRSCVVMLDLECDDLILEMFETFFDTASDEQPHNVFVAMRNILTLVLEESEKIPADMVEVILKSLLKTNKEGSAARKLATAVVDKCAEKLEPYVRSYLTSVMVEGKSLDSGLHKDQHEVIIELYGCAPQLLSGVIPNIKSELVKDKLHVRLKAVQLLGRLFALPGRQFAQEYPSLFSDFLKRFSDKVVDVRVAVINSAKFFLEANSTGEQAAQIIAVLKDRLLDNDDEVRMTVVKALCDLAISDLKSVPTDVLHEVAERLRDKKVVVREAALLELLELYKSYCTKCFEGSVALDKEYEWIPGKIARYCNDKESHDLEIILTEQLFPVAIPVEQQSQHWAFAFSTFDENEKKVFQYIFLQKQKLQQEMQIYLASRQKAKEEETPEVEKKVQSSFKVISNYFVDPQKAEENLQKIHQMKDENVFTALSTLLDPCTSIDLATTVREGLLKKIGEEHLQYDFMKSLATKCGYFFFSKEHVHAITKQVLVYKDSEENRHLVVSSLSLLLEIAIYCSELLADAEEDLLTLLKEPDDSIKEGVVHLMSKAGASFRNKGSSTEGRSNVNLILEQLCLEGNRKQAKYAVSAIAAMSGDSGLMALSVLYGRLVDKLEDNTHLPTVLQSLGCIAQNAMPIFETREDDIIKFVVRNVLRRTSPQEVVDFVPDGDVPSDNVLLKIYALKALVKSFLPKMNAHQRTRLPGLLKVLVKILACGEIADDMKTSDTDKAHLRLAAAKGVLRLARRWDSQIPIDVFHMVVMTVQDQAMHVRLALLRKIHHYLRDRSLNLKYATAYALCAVDTVKEIALEARRFLTDFVDDYRIEAYKAVNGQAEKTTVTLYPEYALVYLVHVLAHHPNYPVVSGDVQPDPAAYEPFYRELVFFLRALIHQEPDGKSEAGKRDDRDSVPLILAILRTIKGYENAVDKTKTETLYEICDIAILITNDMTQKKKLLETYPGVIPLPASVFKILEPKAPEPKVPVAKGAEPKVAEAKAPEPEAVEEKAAELNAAEEKASELNPVEAKASESNAAEAEAIVWKVAERIEAEPKVLEPNVSESNAAEYKSSESKAAEPNESKVSELIDSKVPELDEPMVEANKTKASESDETMAEANEIKAPEADELMAEAKEIKVPESDEPMAETNEIKASESDEPMAETNEIKASESDKPASDANETKAPESGETIVPEPIESKAAEPNGIKVTEPDETKAVEPIESTVPEPIVLKAPDTNGTKVLEPNDSESKAPEPGATTPPDGGDERIRVTEEEKPVEKSSKLDGSHLPPCFTDKDILARFKLGTSLKPDKPSSPRGRKRGKRIDNGDTVAAAEVELEQGEPTPKKGRFDHNKPVKGAVSTGTGVIIKGPSRGGRKSVDKIESVKKAGKKAELDKEPEEEVDEMTSAKRKRGRPKVYGKKDDGMSGDEIAGPSSDTTPTSAKKGKSTTSDQRALTDSGKRKSGRPTKSKSEEDAQEKSAQKKEKVATVSTPDKSAKKASAVEKSPAWKNEGERGGDESLVGCGIKVWWPLDKKFYKGEVTEYDSKKKKHKILYDDGEQEILNLAKERWELTGKQGKTSAKKEKTPTATTTTTLSGTKYPEPKRLKVTSRTPLSQKDESGKPSDTSKEVASSKSTKPTSTPKAAKEAEKTPKASRSISAKEQAASAFDFDDGDEPAAKKQKTSSTVKASGGKQGKAEKAMSTSKDSGTESAKEMSENQPAKEKTAGNAEDDEPLLAGSLENPEREEVKSERTSE